MQYIENYVRFEKVLIQNLHIVSVTWSYHNTYFHSIDIFCYIPYERVHVLCLHVKLCIIFCTFFTGYSMLVVATPLLMSPILYIFSRCLDSNPESCRSKQAR
jgi:hypothetical protein